MFSFHGRQVPACPNCGPNLIVIGEAGPHADPVAMVLIIVIVLCLIGVILQVQPSPLCFVWTGEALTGSLWRFVFDT